MGGSDHIYGNAGNDTIFIQGTENDVWGGDGDDVITGEDNQADIRGENGNDTIITGSTNQSLLGGAGNDYLDSGAGPDYISTGDGNDTVVIRKGDGGVNRSDADWVVDFTDGSDKIKLVGTTFAELSITQSSSSTIISYGDEYLASCSNFVATDLTEDDIVTYDIV